MWRLAECDACRGKSWPFSFDEKPSNRRTDRQEGDGRWGVGSLGKDGFTVHVCFILFAKNKLQLCASRYNNTLSLYLTRHVHMRIVNLYSHTVNDGEDAPKKRPRQFHGRRLHAEFPTYVFVFCVLCVKKKWATYICVEAFFGCLVALLASRKLISILQTKGSPNWSTRIDASHEIRITEYCPTNWEMLQQTANCNRNLITYILNSFNVRKAKGTPTHTNYTRHGSFANSSQNYTSAMSDVVRMWPAGQRFVWGLYYLDSIYLLQICWFFICRLSRR